MDARFADRIWPQLRQSWIVHRDQDLIVIDKPAGIACQAADPERPDDLVMRLKLHLAAERGVATDEVYVGVHQRLDRDTSGLVLYTLRREANAAIAAQLEGRRLRKRYLAVVDDGPALSRARTLESTLAAGGGGGRQRVVRAGARGGKLAITELSPGERRGGRRLVTLEPKTGRTHQLRVQLAELGAPIAGDRLYGGAKAARLMLHAAQLTLEHPSGGSLPLQAPLPPELSTYLERGDVDVLDDAVALSRALERASDARWQLGHARDAALPTSAFRLFQRGAEGSGAFAVDVYDRWLVAHLYDEPVDAAREARLLDGLEELGFEGIYLKRHPRRASVLAARAVESYAPPQPLRGTPAPEALTVYEHGVPFTVRLGDGLRTGLFLDQRDNRRRVGELAKGKRVLNLFAYTGGFSVAALAGGAREALCIDASAAAMAWARDNMRALGAEARHRARVGDAFELLRKLARAGERFDLVVCDPPSYSTTRARRFQAAKHYPELLAACLEVLGPEGEVLCCINHHGVSRGRFRRLLRDGAERAGRAIDRLKDLPPQSDFPSGDPRLEASKAVLLSFASR